MLKSYFAFINESIVKYSDDFRTIIKEIEGTSISKKLLEIENTDHDVPSNYIDIGTDFDTITFTPDQKAQKFLNTGAEEKDIYTHSRQSIKIGRGVRNLLKSANIEFTDSEIEYFVNKFKSKVKQKKEKFTNFELVKGEKIAYWYNLNQYELGELGQLGSSCMRKKGADVLNIYISNPEKVSLLILKSSENPDKIRGRALVWKIDRVDGTQKENFIFMDRVYCHKDSDVELFRSYALENDMYYKSPNDNDEECDVVGKKETIKDISMVVELKENISRSNMFPYMDTLKYLDTDDGNLSNDRDFSHDFITLEDTDGGFDDENCDTCGGDGELECDECGGRGETECYDCDGDGHIDCDECDGSGKIKNDDGEEEECDECGGEGSYECDNCGGRGESECSDCDGSGNVDCWDCR